jgi:hypothetical protein
MAIYNDADVLDSRDIIARIEQLQAIREPGPVEEGVLDPDDYTADQDILFDELAALEALAEQASGASDWDSGEQLIRDSHFQTYARELADELDSAPAQTWPYQHVDWEAAANELQQDYTPVEFAGVTYWIRW